MSISPFFETLGTDPRVYEVGVDRGVLYVENQPGVPWRGLISVSPSQSGGEADPLYYDGKKYLNNSAPTEEAFNIEAFTYPNEFEACLGTSYDEHGIGYTQQNPAEFNLSWRTLIGDAMQGTKRAYKLHLLYNCLATPSEYTQQTLSEDPSPTTFAWNVTTRPGDATGFSPTAHLVLDSRRISAYKMRMIERYLYGTGDIEPRWPSIVSLRALIERLPQGVVIELNTSSGVGSLINVNDDPLGRFPDLSGDEEIGLYTRASDGRLIETSDAGIYRLD